jgi:ABC-2 type transport system ATP-binding protein
MTTEPLVVIEALTKVYRRSGAAPLTAVNGVTLTINRGDVFGFLGPNGAGKSTLLRMMLGLVHPTRGRVSIGGNDLATARLQALRKVGAFVETPAFYPYLSGRKNLEIFAALSGVVTPAEIERAIALVGLTGREHDAVKVYSHGMRARLGIAACLLPWPELMVLDEPTDGLDPHGIREVRELIRRLVTRDKLTVVLSSHMLREVENLCNRIAILENGRAILHGDVAELERQHRCFRIKLDRPQDAARLLKERFGLSARECDAEGMLAPLNGRAPAEINAALVAAGFAVSQFVPEEGWLDRLFLQLTTSRESALTAAEARR